MPPRGIVEQLPSEIRAELDRRLLGNGFADYRGLAEWLTSLGYEIKKSAVHTYGQKFEDRCAALKLATQQAQAIVAESPDDEGAMSEALTRLVQEKLFSVLLEMEVDPKKANLGSMARAIAELGRASVTQKKYAEEVRERAQTAAKEISAIGRKAGISDEAMAEINKRVAGIA